MDCRSPPEPDHWSATALLQLALWYRCWGWTCFPVGPDKKPVCRWKRFQSRRPTDRRLCRLFARAGVAGLAVVPGPASRGLAVRDFDDAGAYHRWAASDPALAASAPTSQTGRGFHVFVRLPPGHPPVYRKFPDGELIADGGHYAVLPPSLHPSGGRYRWLREPVAYADVPEVDPPATPLPATPRTPPRRVIRTANGLCANDPSDRPRLDDLLGRLDPSVREAVLRTVPGRPGVRNARLLTLAQQLLDLAPGADPVVWLPAVRAWWVLAQPKVRTKLWGPTWGEFRRAWDRAAVPTSDTRPKRAMRAAGSGPAPPADRLLAVCRALAAETGGTFHLSGRTAAAALGIPHRTAARLLKDAVAAGRLEVVTRGVPSARKRIATTYRLGPVLSNQQGSEVSR